MVKLSHILIVLLFVFTGVKVARSDDTSDRDRKARVALALTASNAKPAPSPVPLALPSSVRAGPDRISSSDPVVPTLMRVPRGKFACGVAIPQW